MQKQTMKYDKKRKKWAKLLGIIAVECTCAAPALATLMTEGTLFCFVLF